MCTDPVPQFIHCVLTVLGVFLQQVSSHKHKVEQLYVIIQGNPITGGSLSAIG